MTKPQVSSAVMTHPVRLAQAQDLAERLRLDGLALDPAPEGPPSALRTALVAWSAAAPEASHHLVVQDDVDAPAELLEIVTGAAARFPDEALVFYTNWHARNGAAARLAALMRRLLGTGRPRRVHAVPRCLSALPGAPPPSAPTPVTAPSAMTTNCSPSSSGGMAG